MEVLLRSFIVEKIGFDITDVDSSKLLSEIILEETGNNVSYNTIRRFFGLVKSVKPRIYTLDILSTFVGFKSYGYFKLNSNLNIRWKLQLKLTQLILQDNPKELLIFIQENLHKQAEFKFILAHLLRELLLTNKIKLLNEIFELKEMNILNFNWDDTVLIGNSVGSLLSKLNLTSKEEENLVLNENFQDLVITLFVDYSGLNSFYINIIQLIEQNSKRSDIVAFCRGILNLANFLSEGSMNNFYTLKMHDAYHPILKSRILAQSILKQEKNKLKKLEEYYTINNKKGVLEIDYLFEIIVTAIILKDFEVMEWVIAKVRNHKNYKFFYKHEHYENFMFMNILFYFKNKDQEALSNFSFSGFNTSYEPMLTLFYLIYDYHRNNEQMKKKEILVKYLSLAQKVYKPFFTKEYLLNYFI
jgi:hypothetical protein